MNKVIRIGKLLLTLNICIILIACSKVTQENFEKIKAQMTLQQVIAILGEPTNSESINIGGISGTSAIWKDKNGEIDIQFLNDKVVVKSFSKPNEEKHPTVTKQA